MTRHRLHYTWSKTKVTNFVKILDDGVNIDNWSYEELVHAVD